MDPRTEVAPTIMKSAITSSGEPARSMSDCVTAGSAKTIAFRGITTGKIEPIEAIIAIGSMKATGSVPSRDGTGNWQEDRRYRGIACQLSHVGDGGSN